MVNEHTRPWPVVYATRKSIMSFSNCTANVLGSRHDCPYHGELRERSACFDAEYDSDDTIDTVDALDIDHPPNINFKKRVNHLANTSMDDGDWNEKFEEDHTRAQPTSPAHHHDHPGGFAKAHLHDDRPPFIPCHHPNYSCEDANCRCFRDQVHCEKSCGCALKCDRRFKGCSCSVTKPRKGGKVICFDDDRCACYQQNRECDPDLCGDCAAAEVLDPENRYDDEIQNHRHCHNVAIQLGRPRRTLLGRSRVHGFGLYAGERIRQHDFIGEYQGEILTKGEADRRGAVYEKQKLSYLFTLNRGKSTPLHSLPPIATAIADI